MDYRFIKKLNNLKRINPPYEHSIVEILHKVFNKYLQHPEKLEDLIEKNSLNYGKINLSIPIPDSIISDDNNALEYLKNNFNSILGAWISSTIDSDSNNEIFYFDFHVFFWYIDNFKKEFILRTDIDTFFEEIISYEDIQRDNYTNFYVTSQMIGEIFLNKSDQELLLIVGMMRYWGYFDPTIYDLKGIYGGIKFKTKKNKIGLTTSKFQEYIEELKFRRNLFQKMAPEEKIFIIKEHKKIFILQSNHLWIEAIIKMVSILEFLITDWGLNHLDIVNRFKRKKSVFSKKNPGLFERLEIIIDIIESGEDVKIGTMKEWGKIQSIWRRYRNRIHLINSFTYHLDNIIADYEECLTSYTKLITFF